jgi:hypothetical protein
MLKLLAPSGHVKGFNGIALPLPLPHCRKERGWRSEEISGDGLKEIRRVFSSTRISAPNGQIFMKFDMRIFFWKLCQENSNVVTILQK